MADEKKTETVPEVPTLIGPAPISANGVGVAGTRWCLQLNFVSPVIHGESGMDIPVAKINIDWPLAKALYRILGQTITEYESAEGQISLPKSFALADNHEATK